MNRGISSAFFDRTRRSTCCAYAGMAVRGVRLVRGGAGGHFFSGTQRMRASGIRPDSIDARHAVRASLPVGLAPLGQPGPLLLALVDRDFCGVGGRPDGRYLQRIRPEYQPGKRQRDPIRAFHRSVRHGVIPGSGQRAQSIRPDPYPGFCAGTDVLVRRLSLLSESRSRHRHGVPTGSAPCFTMPY